MNIDLLFTKTGEAGLISSGNWVKKIVGVLYDTQSGVLSIEYADMDYLELNIPVDSDYNPALDLNATIHIGAVKNDVISQAYQVPLLFSDDPYRNELIDTNQPTQPLAAFNTYLRACTTGQPVNRDDLGNEEAMGCILGAASPASLDFAPHLSRRHSLEARPAAQPALNAPGMRLGGGGGGTAYRGRSGGASRPTDKKNPNDKNE